MVLDGGKYYYGLVTNHLFSTLRLLVLPLLLFSVVDSLFIFIQSGMSLSEKALVVEIGELPLMILLRMHPSYCSF